jgi:hypothetical protein
MQSDDEKDDVMVCGVICGECDYYPEECPGCRGVSGAPFWVDFVGIDRCPVYECCVEDKKLDNCGHCEDLPCERFTRYKDPSISDEDAADKLERIVARLKEGRRKAE